MPKLIFLINLLILLIFLIIIIIFFNRSNICFGTINRRYFYEKMETIVKKLRVRFHNKSISNIMQLTAK